MASTINYQLIDGEMVGVPSVTVAGDTTQRLTLGKILVGTDQGSAAYGDAEFLYVKFTGTVAAGDFVLVDRFAKTAIQSPTSATSGNYGVAMGAQTTGCYGFVMIRGVMDAANVTTGKTAGTLLSGSATAGRASSAVANYILDGVLEKNTAASNVGIVELYYPVCSGR